MHHRAFFDLGHPDAARTVHVAAHLFHHQFDGSPALIGEHHDVFETHQRLEDFVRVDKDEGASCF